jgi:hypothetical protein
MDMSSYLNQSKITLKERLSLHVGYSVAIQAKGFTGEPGVLQRVGQQFIKVNEQYFIPSKLDQIALLGLESKAIGSLVYIRSLTRGSFSTHLIRTGLDFVEIMTNNTKKEWLLIPLNKIISIEKR